MKKQLMIDYRDGEGGFIRKVIDDFEFCIRKGFAYFKSDGVTYAVPIEDVSQVYTN